MENSTQENSTQKLLDTIRGGEFETHKISNSPISTPISQLINLKTIKQKTLTLGILFGKSNITLALTVEKGINKRKSLIKWSNIKISEDLDIQDDGFPAFLELNLNEFLEGRNKVPIWCALDSEHLKIKNFMIPDISRSKIANAAFWGMKKEIEFDTDQEIFDFHLTGTHLSEGIKKKKILGFIAAKKQVGQLEAIFSASGYNLIGITALPFAIQNYIHTRHLQVEESPFIIVNLSRENSEMFCFSGSDMLLARKIRTGLYGLIEDFASASNTDVPDYISSINDFHDDEFSQIRMSCERLINKIMRTGEYCSQNFVDNKPIAKCLFFGELDECIPFMKFVKKTIPAAVEKLEPLFDRLPGTIETELPQNVSEKSKVISAFGIALSSNDYTPNFIYTFRDKAKKKTERNINIGTSMVFILLFSICFLFSDWQETIKIKEKTQLEALTQKHRSFSPDVNLKTTRELINSAMGKYNMRNQYITTYLPLAVISEICSITPDNINITTLESDFIDPKNKQDIKGNAIQKVRAKVMIAGLLITSENKPESDFTEYILNLGDSKLFENITVLKQKTNPTLAGSNLKFKLVMEVL